MERVRPGLRRRGERHRDHPRGGRSGRPGLVVDALERGLPEADDELCAFFFAEKVKPSHDDLIPKNRTDTNTAAVLRLARQIIAQSDGALDAESLEAQLRALAEESGWKPRELFMALRYAMTGKKVSPPIVESMAVLGKAVCIERIDAAIDILGSPENPILGPSGREA
ncbi:MAG: hypothetical protein ACYTF8_15775 [Planctomycetota bacterium]